MNDSKTATINIKMTVAMKKNLISKARGKSLSLSTFCRMVLSDFLKGVKDGS